MIRKNIGKVSAAIGTLTRLNTPNTDPLMDPFTSMIPYNEITSDADYEPTFSKPTFIMGVHKWGDQNRQVGP